jgi:hypothetical protein
MPIHETNFLDMWIWSGLQAKFPIGQTLSEKHHVILFNNWTNTDTQSALNGVVCIRKTLPVNYIYIRYLAHFAGKNTCSIRLTY